MRDRLGMLVRTLAAVAALAAPAAAEGDRALSIGIGYATLSGPGMRLGQTVPPTVSAEGGAISLMYEHSLGSDVSLRGEIGAHAFNGGAYAGLAGIDAVYRYDVVKWVPYVFGGLGTLAAGGGPIDRGLQPVLTVGGGVDWLLSRDRSVSILPEVQLASFGGDVTVFSVELRGSIRWGYF